MTLTVLIIVAALVPVLATGAAYATVAVSYWSAYPPASARADSELTG